MPQPTAPQIKQWARALNFDLVGIAPAAPIDHTDYFKNFIAQNHQGDMTYLARHLEKRLDPRQLLPWAQTIICTATSYHTPEPPAPDPNTPTVRIAAYAQRRDYHDVLRTRLQALADRIHHAASSPVRTRICVDTAPLAEKAHAARAGLGWIGKNTLLLNEQFGSWLSLGEIITDLPLDCDAPVPNKCQDCDCCLRACPTNALTASHQIDPRRCIAYLTIESKSPVPTELAPALDHHLFGCDQCQLACPYNHSAPFTTNPDLQPLPQCQNIPLSQARQWTQNEFTTLFQSTPLSRLTWPHFQQILNTCQQDHTSNPM